MSEIYGQAYVYTFIKSSYIDINVQSIYFLIRFYSICYIKLHHKNCDQCDNFFNNFFQIEMRIVLKNIHTYTIDLISEMFSDRRQFFFPLFRYSQDFRYHLVIIKLYICININQFGESNRNITKLDLFSA